MRLRKETAGFGHSRLTVIFRSSVTVPLPCAVVFHREHARKCPTKRIAKYQKALLEMTSLSSPWAPFITPAVPEIPSKPFGRVSSLLSLGLVLPAQPPQLSLTTTSKQPKIPKWLHEQPATLPQYSAPVLGLRELGSEPAEGAEWPPTRRIRHSPVICHGLCVPSFTVPLSPRLGLNHTPVIFRFTPVARSVPGQF